MRPARCRFRIDLQDVMTLASPGERVHVHLEQRVLLVALKPFLQGSGSVAEEQALDRVEQQCKAEIYKRHNRRYVLEGTATDSNGVVYVVYTRERGPKRLHCTPYDQFVEEFEVGSSQLIPAAA